MIGTELRFPSRERLLVELAGLGVPARGVVAVGQVACSRASRGGRAPRWAGIVKRPRRPRAAPLRSPACRVEKGNSIVLHVGLSAAGQGSASMDGRGGRDGVGPASRRSPAPLLALRPRGDEISPGKPSTASTVLLLPAPPRPTPRASCLASRSPRPARTRASLSSSRSAACVRHQADRVPTAQRQQQHRSRRHCLHRFRRTELPAAGSRPRRCAAPPPPGSAHVGRERVGRLVPPAQSFSSALHHTQSSSLRKRPVKARGSVRRGPPKARQRVGGRAGARPPAAPPRRTSEDLQHPLHSSSCRERRRAGQQLVEHPQGVDVRAGVDVQLLSVATWAHMLRRADHPAYITPLVALRPGAGRWSSRGPLGSGEAETSCEDESE